MKKLKAIRKKYNTIAEISEIVTITSEDSEFVCATQKQGTSDMALAVAVTNLAKLKNKNVKLTLAEPGWSRRGMPDVPVREDLN